MPKINDSRLLQGKINRNNEIYKYFKKRFDHDGIRYEIIEEEIILKFGVSVSAITKIMKIGLVCQ